MQMLIIKLTKDNEAQDRVTIAFKVTKLLAKPPGGLRSMKPGPHHPMEDLDASSTSGTNLSFLDS